MTIENFIRDALYKPSDYIAYHVARELAELHPGKTIVEGKTGYFGSAAGCAARLASPFSERADGALPLVWPLAHKILGKARTTGIALTC
jgi:hypothetical protein